MSAEPCELPITGKEDYKLRRDTEFRKEVEEILENTNEPVSVADIRIELDYRQNDFIRSEEYSLSELEEDISGVIEELQNNPPNYSNGEFARTLVIQESGPIPAEIRDTGERYSIIGA